MAGGRLVTSCRSFAGAGAQCSSGASATRHPDPMMIAGPPRRGRRCSEEVDEDGDEYDDDDYDDYDGEDDDNEDGDDDDQDGDGGDGNLTGDSQA